MPSAERTHGRVDGARRGFSGRRERKPAENKRLSGGSAPRNGMENEPGGGAWNGGANEVAGRDVVNGGEAGPNLRRPEASRLLKKKSEYTNLHSASI